MGLFSSLVNSKPKSNIFLGIVDLYNDEEINKNTNNGNTKYWGAFKDTDDTWTKANSYSELPECKNISKICLFDDFGRDKTTYDFEVKNKSIQLNFAFTYNGNHDVQTMFVLSYDDDNDDGPSVQMLHNGMYNDEFIKEAISNKDDTSKSANKMFIAYLIKTLKKVCSSVDVCFEEVHVDKSLQDDEMNEYLEAVGKKIEQTYKQRTLSYIDE